ncbi:unnamed protein product (macronuclear) [Paramecium tetraurelia]|uniref:Uncharacterized protein n=1 Tax=Paramecium tetraurelia TaxID=5888 RepID=A0DFK2_PARTE|nr:uncharacterized protein GSPATT00016632001 [Paramecium tetraurelia]CAK81819.1 unnamed protein product [Paramecium tetraurelia]|eukprot:XP_001449216.1 hypothetical protein (macronuclear) [Paramecium tetraurelia strain d4-2]
MDITFNQLDVLQKIMVERGEDIRLLNAINQQVLANQMFFDLEFTKVQQSLRQLGFKIIGLKKNDKQRIEEENKIIEALSKILMVNLPERMQIYRFSQTIIKQFRPEMHIIRFNQKDTKDLFSMFKQFFMAENNFDGIHFVQSNQESDFKMSTAIVLIKFLVSRSREEFQLLIQSASTSVIGKMKQQLEKKTDDTTNDSKVEKTEPEERKPKLLLRKKVIIVRENTNYKSQLLYSQPQESNLNPEKELKYQLRLQQRKLRKDLKNIYQPMIDLDNDHMWCSHAVLKKKFLKYPEKYFLKRGAFYIWKLLNNNNSDIRITIMNFAYRRAKLVIVDKILQEQIQELHKHYNTTGQIPRQSLPLLVSCQQTPKIMKPQIRLQQQLQVPNMSQLPILRSQHQQIKSMEFYEVTTKDQRAHKSNKSLNLTQEQAKIQQKIKLQSSKDLI